ANLPEIFKATEVVNRGSPRAAPPQPKGLGPRITRMSANRESKDFCWISRSFGSATRPRVAFKSAGPTQKRREDAPHSKSIACLTLARFASISVIRGQKNLRKLRRIRPIALQIARMRIQKRQPLRSENASTQRGGYSYS